MKKVGYILLGAFFAICGQLSAQQKYGHINSNEVVQAMPEFKQMSASVEKKKKDAETQLQGMYQSYQAKAKELNDYGASMMEAIREERMKELDSLQRTIAGYEQKAQADIQDYQTRLLKPLNDKYLKIVNAVAKENGYTYIFDLSTNAVAYYPENTGDITDLVKKKLGVN